MIRPGVPWILFLALCASFAGPTAQSAGPADLGWLGGDPAFTTAFGQALAVDGDWLAIGDPSDKELGSANGAVTVYARLNQSWFEQQRLVPAIDNPGQDYGARVALAEDVLVVGVPEDDTVGINTGAIEVFLLDYAGVWLPVATFVDAAGTTDDRFGGELAATRDWILATAAFDNVSAGTVHVYRRTDNGTPAFGGDDTWVETQTLVAPTPASGAQFGRALAISGSLAVAGAFGEDSATGEEQAGAAYVLAESGGVWSVTERLTHTPAGLFNWFGRSVATDGSSVFVGAPGYNLPLADSGAVYVFEPGGAGYVETAALSPTDGGFFGSQTLGTSLAVSGSRLAAGAQAESPVSDNEGTAYVFEKGSAGWSLAAKVTACAPVANDFLGSEIALDEGGGGPLNLLVAARTAAAGTVTGGVVFEYRFTDVAAVRVGVGDGSAAACPCDNESVELLGQGCLNSTGFGARLTPFGNLNFAACGLPLVTGGQLARLEAELSDPTGSSFFEQPFAGGRPWSAGSTWIFQTWYRDSLGSPCTTSTNLTSGVAVTFN